MELHSAKLVEPADSYRPAVQLTSGQIVENFHGGESCLGSVCPVHKPSDHPYRDLPLAFTGGHMVRILPGIVPNPMAGVEVSGIEGIVAVIIDPDDYGLRSSGSAIIRNSGYCIVCGDHIVSHYTHDYKSCSCGKSAVDGGNSYLRRTGHVLDTSLVFSSPEGADLP